MYESIMLAKTDTQTYLFRRSWLHLRLEAVWVALEPAEHTHTNAKNTYRRDEREGFGDRVEDDGEHDDDGQHPPRHDLRVVDAQGLGQQLAEEQRRDREGRGGIRQSRRPEHLIVTQVTQGTGIQDTRSSIKFEHYPHGLLAMGEAETMKSSIKRHRKMSQLPTSW